MMNWHLLPTISAAMPFQMALDEILLRRMERRPASDWCPTLRFYFSSEPWITVGYSHRGNGRAHTAKGLPICARLTGGGAVEHGKDLIFSLVAAKTHDDSFSSVRISYLKIHEAVKAAFESAGRSPRFYRCDESLPKGADCFRFPIPTDLAFNGRKIAGGAQKRSAGVMLHQESIQFPGSSVQNTAFIDRARLSFERVFRVQIKRAELEPGLLQEAETLSSEKYAVAS